MAEWILIITLGTTCGIGLAQILQWAGIQTYVRAKAIDIQKLKKKLFPKRPTEEHRRLTKELQILLKRKPTKAQGPQALGYFIGLLRKTNPDTDDLTLRQVVQDGLDKFHG